MQHIEQTGVRTGKLADDLIQMLGRVVVGQERVIQELLVALLARGHVLLEGVPGTAKTLLVRALGVCLGMEFKRIQMTPDLMPSDIVGTNVFDLASNTFNLRKGPIFTGLLLADEINRAPAKTQSALLEGMQERQVTIDGITHPLDPNFTVFATQNPIEYEGTYPLPEAQLDRFVLKVIVDYLSEQEEDELLSRYNSGFDAMDLAAAGLAPVATADDLAACRAEILAVNIEDKLLHYVSQITRATRQSPSLVVGCSPRASVMLLQTSKVLAALRGRGYVIPDDVKDMAAPTLRHRVVLRPEADIEGLTPDEIIMTALAAVPVPR